MVDAAMTSPGDTLTGKHVVTDLAAFGARPMFSVPKSTSNLVQPDFARFLDYLRPAPQAVKGAVVARLETRFAAFHRTEHCVSFCSGFWALATTMMALALPGRREVLMPSLTYRRMADVVAWTGLLPRFCEVDPDTLAISVASARDALHADTALLLGVHPIVNCCDVRGLVGLAEQHQVPLLFDSVESVYEDCEAGKVGGFGNAECFSLHASKLINGFEGGYVTTNDAVLARRLIELRDGRTTAPGSIDARLADVHAAMALANLDELDSQVARNRVRYERYRDLLAHLPGVRLLTFDGSRATSYKTIVVEFTDDWPLARELTVELLNAENVLARAYYWPALHAKTMAYPHVAATMPVSDQLSLRYALLPCGDFVTGADIDATVALLDFVRRHADDIRARAQRGEQAA